MDNAQDRAPVLLLAPAPSPGSTHPFASGGRLTPPLLRNLCAHLRTIRSGAIARMPLADIIAAIDRAAAGWAGAADAEIAMLAGATGYHPSMVRLALRDLAWTFCAAALERLLRRELPQPGALDRFVPRPDGGLERAYGPELTAVVLSGNVFHVAAESVALALLAKSACLIKASARDRLFPLLFARSLAAADARLAAVLAVASWPGGDAQLESAAFGGADAVVAYGGAEAIAAVRGRTPPQARFIAHGPKISFAVVGRSHARGAAGVEAARAAAHDVAMFDQQGCVSPHTLYVEGGAEDARGFARLLAAAMAQVEAETPRGQAAAVAAAQIQQVRGAAELRPGTELFTDAGGTAWTVIADADPAFAASCLNRVAYVKPLAHPAELPGLLAPVQPFLQTVGVAGDPALRRLVAEIVGPLGVARVCPLGRMQHPPADWRHDGRPRLLDLLRWTDLDEAGSGAAR